MSKHNRNQKSKNRDKNKQGVDRCLVQTSNMFPFVCDVSSSSCFSAVCRSCVVCACMYVVPPLLSVIVPCCVLCSVWCLLWGVCCVLYVVCCILCVVCSLNDSCCCIVVLSCCHRLTSVACGATPTGTSRTNFFEPHPSHLAPLTSHLSPHTSHLTPHTSHKSIASEPQSIKASSLKASKHSLYVATRVRTSTMNAPCATSAEEKARAESRLGRQERKKAQQKAFKTGVWDRCRYRVPGRERYCAQPRWVLVQVRTTHAFLFQGCYMS